MRKSIRIRDGGVASISNRFFLTIQLFHYESFLTSINNFFYRTTNPAAKLIRSYTVSLLADHGGTTKHSFLDTVSAWNRRTPAATVFHAFPILYVGDIKISWNAVSAIVAVHPFLSYLINLFFPLFVVTYLTANPYFAGAAMSERSEKADVFERPYMHYTQMVQRVTSHVIDAVSIWIPKELAGIVIDTLLWTLRVCCFCVVCCCVVIITHRCFCFCFSFCFFVLEERVIA